ncbi:replicative DNA helicase [Ligilactobacillus salitolerans]|uniref:Replicative DNA helicase n=1 Tax=Ligilactobacillus salitolerans TaxID=1808352 RepID=A0A401IVU6_9LACO|nr:DnaD domain protein [Ligilactobacillus salitolerans]GBG95638.1 replicative DNA helicase [Ligilactobacillus salitolerans]
MTENLKDISPKDGFVVVANHTPGGQELRALMDLYVPMMGSQAYGTYVLLSRYGKTHPNLVKRSMNKELLLALSVGMRDFLEAREKLEGLGLLRTFEKKDRLGKLNLYYLQAPLLGTDFFKDDLLSTLLLETVGQGPFRKLREEYCPPEFKVEGSTEVTHSFLEVFPIQRSTLLKNAASKPLPKNEEQAQQLIERNNGSLDLKFFRQLLAKSFVPEQEALKNMDAIQTLHLLYGLDELQLVRLLEEAIDINSNKLNVKYLKLLAHNSFEFQMKSDQQESKQAAQLGSKNASEQSSGAQPDRELLEACKSFAPMEFLQALKNQTNNFPTKAENYMVSNLVKQRTLPNQVINVLIHYYLGDRGYAEMRQDYFEGTAARWSQKGIKTAEEAMAAVRNSVAENAQKKTNYSKKSNYRSKRPVVQKEQLPDWAQQDYQAPQSSQEESSKKANLQAEIKRRLAEIDRDK